MKRAAIFLGLAMANAPSVQSQTPAKSAAIQPIAALGWLVGGVWIADGSQFGPGLKRVETRYVWSDNSAYIRFTTHFVTDNATLKNYDGNFFWNPEQSTLSMWYMDARNSITQSPVTTDANSLVMRFHGPNFEGTPADLRVTVTRKSNDLYNWSVDEARPEANAGWKHLASADYRRLSAP